MPGIHSSRQRSFHYLPGHAPSAGGRAGSAAAGGAPSRRGPGRLGVPVGRRVPEAGPAAPPSQGKGALAVCRGASLHKHKNARTHAQPPRLSNLPPATGAGPVVRTLHICRTPQRQGEVRLQLPDGGGVKEGKQWVPRWGQAQTELPPFVFNDLAGPPTCLFRKRFRKFVLRKFLFTSAYHMIRTTSPEGQRKGRSRKMYIVAKLTNAKLMSSSPRQITDAFVASRDVTAVVPLGSPPSPRNLAGIVCRRTKRKGTMKYRNSISGAGTSTAAVHTK